MSMQSTTSPQSLHVNSSSTSPHVKSSSTSPPSNRIANPEKKTKEGKQVNDLYDDLYDDLLTPNSKKLNVDVVTESPRNRSDSNNLKIQSNKQPTIISTKLNFDNSINDQDVKMTTTTKTLHQSSSKTKTLYRSSTSKTEPKLDLKFVDDEYMGPHGDYGGKKSDDFFMMRLKLGIGGEWTVVYEATKLD